MLGHHSLVQLGLAELDFLEASHGVIQLRPTVNHELELIHAVTKDDHLAAHGLIAHIAQGLTLEIGQIMLPILVEQFHYEFLAVELELIFEWIGTRAYVLLILE